MGIFGLHGLLEQNKQLFATKEQLKDTNLVIDCNNLQHFLLERAALNERSSNFRVDKYGCNFPTYAHLVSQFFNTLNECGVTPILVVDGSPSGKGDYTGLVEYRKMMLQERDQTKMLDAQQVTEYPIEKGNLLIPRLFKVVFREVVRKLGIEVHQVAYEANHLITKLANDLDCPVLAGDSDFIIYPINKGFIFLKMFFYKRKEGCDYLDCYIFKQETFIRNFPDLRAECLPLVNVLLGKASEKMRSFEDIVFPIVGQGDLDTKFVAKTYLNQRLIRLLEWLRGKTQSEVVDFILEHFEPERRAEKLEFIEKLMNVYRYESATDIEEELERIYPIDQLDRDIEESPSRYLSRLFSQYDLTGPCLNIILGKPDHDVSFLGNFLQPSPYKLEFRPFSVAMALLRPKSIDRMEKEETHQPESQIFRVSTRSNQDEIEPEIGTFDITPMECMDRFGSLNWLDCYSMILLPRARKRQLLMDTFRYGEAEFYTMDRVTLELFRRHKIRKEVTTCMMLIKYYAIETRTELDGTIVASLLMMFFNLGIKHNAVDMSYGRQETFRVLNKSIKIHEPKRNRQSYPDDPELYRQVVHNILSLQAIYRSYCMLNNLLDNPCDPVEPDVWFDGTLMYRLMLLTRTDGLRSIHGCCPQFENLFNRVMMRLEESVNENTRRYEANHG